MVRETVENGLWGVKGNLKEDLEGSNVPVWLSPPGGRGSALNYVTSRLEDGQNAEFDLRVDPTKAPERVRSNIEEWEENNGEAEEWLLTVKVDGEYLVNQQEMELVAVV